ncbi:MAG: hypothetical protein Q7K40_01725 [bacterium]|nr:hypothetical protein [bacterium]
MNIQEVLHGENRKKIIIGIVVVIVIILLLSITVSVGKKNTSEADLAKQTETQILADLAQLSPPGEGENGVLSHSERVRLEMPLITLSADTTTVAPGQPAVITWASKNATDCADGIGNQIRLEGSYSITPKEDYTLDILCTGPKGAAAQSLTISVITAPLINLSAYPTEVAPGQQSFITWNTSNATSCLDGSGKTLRLNDTLAITPLRAYTFEIKCTGEKGTAKKSLAIAVNPRAQYATTKTGTTGTVGTVKTGTPPTDSKTPIKVAPIIVSAPGERTVTSVGPGPKITLTFNPDTLLKDTDSSTFSWTVENATSCTHSAPTGIVVPSATNSSATRLLTGAAVDEAGLFSEMTGSKQIWLPSGKTSAKITFNCVSVDGRSTASNTLSLDNALASITAKPTIELFANPGTVSAGGTSEVSWETTNTIPGGQCFARVTAEAHVYNPVTDTYGSSLYSSKAGVPVNGKMKVTPGLSNSPIPGGGTSFNEINAGAVTGLGPGLTSLLGGGDDTSWYTPANVTLYCGNRFGTTEKSITVQVPPPPDCGGWLSCTFRF